MRTLPPPITAIYRITTPMFIGDADQHATGIGAGAVKGALRFWWRALNWGRVLDAEAGDQAKALCRLHGEEGGLFGSAAENGPGQARVLIQVRAADMRKAALGQPGCGVQYLLGQGLYHFNRGYLRDALAPGAFELVCRLRPDTPETARRQLIDALLALGTLGGLGSRARKGFGSLAIQSITQGDASIPVPTDKAGLKTLIASWHQTPDLPPFTAFSRVTRVDCSLEGRDPLVLLEAAGREFQLYRSWGRNGKVCGKDSERNFMADHHLMDAVTKGERPASIPARSVFGLPHNYFFSSTNLKADFGLHEDDRSRRAAPLFIHVHQFPSGAALLLHALLPARFLTVGDQLEFKPNRGRPQHLAFDDRLIDWGRIHTYMDRFATRETAL